MNSKDKAAQRTTLVLGLGLLLRPLQDLARQSPPPAASAYNITAAKCRRDLEQWYEEVRTFCTFDGYALNDLCQDILLEPQNLIHYLGQYARNSDDTARQLEFSYQLSLCRELTLAAIDRVPIEWNPHLHDAKTPLSVHFHIRDAIGTAKQRVHFFDRYLDADFYPLYLRELSRNIEVRLITTKGKLNFGVTNVLPVSKLAAGEFQNYQLIECLPADLHDRNLRIDGAIFHLGPSIKEAGTSPTNFTPADGSVNAHAILDSIIAKGVSVH